MIIEQIMKDILESTTNIANHLGADPSKHGMLQGTFDGALAEAQSGEIMKVKNFTPANQSFKHYNSMRDSANALVNSLDKFRSALTRLSAIDFKAANLTDKTYRPLIETAASRVDLAQKTEQMIIELANTGNSTRLQGVPLNQGRDAANLISNQLSQKGLTLLPPQLSAQGITLLQRIRQLPITFEQSREQVRQILTMGFSAGVAVRRTIQGAISQALTSTIETIAAFGSRFTSFFLIPTFLLEEFSDKPKGA